MSTRFFRGETAALPRLTHEAMLAYFVDAARPRATHKVGAEVEWLVVNRSSGEQLSFGGAEGIEQILTRVAERFGWQRFHEGERLVALLRDGASLTLEPGGQVELSSAPYTTLHALRSEVDRVQMELRSVVDPARVAWIALGVTPFSDVEQIALMPKARYQIMDSYLAPRAPYVRQMMRGTTSIQAAFDYSDEADAVKKFVTAITLSPVVNAIFSNSPLYLGAPTGHISFRGQIWDGMDPDRSGLLADFVRFEDFSFERWVQYLRSRPMMFYCIDDEFIPAHGRTFESYLQEGYQGHFPDMDDWEMHLTSIFPDVRLKKYLEIRGADCVPAPLSLALPAIWKGLIYDDDTLEEALRLARSLADPADRIEVFRRAYRQGLTAEWKGRSIGAWARDVLGLAQEGLRRQALAEGIEDESPFLLPAQEIARTERSLSRQLLERWPKLAGRPEAVVAAIEWPAAG